CLTRGIERAKIAQRRRASPLAEQSFGEGAREEEDGGIGGQEDHDSFRQPPPKAFTQHASLAFQATDSRARFWTTGGTVARVAVISATTISAMPVTNSIP